jgi:hypothetical protein
MSDALEMTTIFYYPTLELFGFSFTQPFTHLKFCLLNHFLFGATPTINNDCLTGPSEKPLWESIVMLSPKEAFQST